MKTQKFNFGNGTLVSYCMNMNEALELLQGAQHVDLIPVAPKEFNNDYNILNYALVDHDSNKRVTLASYQHASLLTDGYKLINDIMTSDARYIINTLINHNLK